jgi:parallel beta-helix repeat protein
MRRKHFVLRSMTLVALSTTLTFFLGLLPALHAATSCVNPGGTGGCHSSIQSAVDAASSGDTIHVATGIYSEAVTINKSLTLRANGAANIQGCFSLAADNVTVDGFSFNGGDSCPGAGERGAIYMVANTDGHAITGNTLNGPGTTQVYRGILFGYNVRHVTISGNDISGWLSGVYINPSSNIVIEGNDFYANSVGIGSDGLSHVSILGNTFADNESEGLGSSSVGASVEAHGNRFNGNNGTAVAHYSGQPIDATHNWWGHKSGPYHPMTNPTGQGDEVSDNVLYDPWTKFPVWDIPSSMVGSEYRHSSDLVNCFLLLFVPMGVLLVWKAVARTR